MIVYDLSCDSGHRFEGWFGSSAEFDRQQASGLVACPECGSPQVDKAPMAPAVPKKGSRARKSVPHGERSGEAEAGATQEMTRGPLPPEVAKALENLAAAQRRALRDSKWVGAQFAEQSRAMHYGERDGEAIHGQASLEDAQALLEEGITIAPLPFPIAPPEDLN